jgi:hypothetical protein
MEKEQVPINSSPMTMVLLPQTVWQEMDDKLNKLMELMNDGHGPLNLNNPMDQIRIPLAQFKNDVELQHRYGLTYTVVREITKNNLLRSYCDPDRQRYRWTTHEDIMDYLTKIKTAGIKI